MNYSFCAVIITVLNASHSLKHDVALSGEGLEIQSCINYTSVVFSA